MGNSIDGIARWVSELRYEDIPGRVIDKARLQILNILAATVSGKYCEALKPTVSLAFPPGDATVIQAGGKTDAAHAAFMNALYSMTFDFDDYLFMGHTGHSSVLAPLALAEERDLTLKDVLLAQVAANEVEGRLGASVLFGPHNGQMWSYIHAVGAATASSKMLGLSKEQTASAIALSLYQPNYALYPGFMHGDSKLFTAAVPILSGMLYAGFARAGMRGNAGILDVEHGFLSHFSYVPLPHLFSGLGDWWVTDTIAFKPYPGCAYIDTTIDCIYGIMAQYLQDKKAPLALSDIKHVDVFANILTVGMTALSEMYDDRTLNPVNINFSIPKSAAIALIHHALGPEHLGASMLSKHAGDIRSLAEKVTLHHDWRYTLSMQGSFYEAIGSGFMLRDTGALALVKAFFRMRKDLPKIKLDLQGLLKAWTDMAPGQKETIKKGLRKKDDYVKMERFVFSFGARVRLETNDAQVYEAESIIPRGASSDRRDVVVQKLSSAVGSDTKAAALFDLTVPQTPARQYVKQVVEGIA